jgi:hypothetical protein
VSLFGRKKAARAEAVAALVQNGWSHTDKANSPDAAIVGEATGGDQVGWVKDLASKDIGGRSYYAFECTAHNIGTSGGGRNFVAVNVSAPGVWPAGDGARTIITRDPHFTRSKGYSHEPVPELIGRAGWGVLHAPGSDDDTGEDVSPHRLDACPGVGAFYEALVTAPLDPAPALQIVLSDRFVTVTGGATYDAGYIEAAAALLGRFVDVFFGSAA